jgi:hypothetical protein
MRNSSLGEKVAQVRKYRHFRSADGNRNAIVETLQLRLECVGAGVRVNAQFRNCLGLLREKSGFVKHKRTQAPPAFRIRLSG